MRLNHDFSCVARWPLFAIVDIQLGVCGKKRQNLFDKLTFAYVLTYEDRFSAQIYAI